MKKIIVLIFVLLLNINTNLALAQSSPTSTVVPQSTLSFLRTWKEKIEKFTTYGAERRAKMYLTFAEDRLNEFQTLKTQGKEDLAQRALNLYLEELDQAITNLQLAQGQQHRLDTDEQKIMTSLQRQLVILTTIYENVPQPIKSKILMAMEKIQQGYRILKILVSGQQKELVQEKYQQSKNKANNLIKGIFRFLWPTN